MAATELHVNATYYAQHPTLKSVYEKSQSVIVGKLFATYRLVFEQAQYSKDVKSFYRLGVQNFTLHSSESP